MKSKKIAFPLIIKRGNSTVKIYSRERGGYPQYSVAYYATGKRKMETFGDLEKARLRADEINNSVNDGQVETLTLTPLDRLECTRAMEMLTPLNLSLTQAIIEFASAKKILSGASVIEAAEFYHRKHPSVLLKQPLSVIIEAYFQNCFERGLDMECIKHTRWLLKRFEKVFQCDIASITSDEIKSFIACKNHGAVTRNSEIRRLGAFFKFAIKKHFLPKHWDEFSQVEFYKEPDGEIDIYSPAEIANLLSKCVPTPLHIKRKSGDYERMSLDHRLLPMFAIGAFAGLRTAELLRLDWRQVGVGGGKYIEVKAANAKTRERRLIPIADNLREWIKPHLKNEGLVWPKSRAAYMDYMWSFCKRTGFVWKHNALRHSFISYRVAQTQDVAKVSLEAGNSPRIIFKHYRELVSSEDAAAYFSLTPANFNDKIVHLKTAVA